MSKTLWINIKMLWATLTAIAIWGLAIQMANADHHLGDEDVAAAIQSANQKLMDCMNTGDEVCAAMQYTSNAVYMGPNSEPLIGRDAIRDNMVDDGTSVVQLITDEIEVHGDTATELGTYVTESRDGQHLDHGSYVVIWKRTNEGWKLHWDIFNTNMGN